MMSLEEDDEEEDSGVEGDTGGDGGDRQKQRQELRGKVNATKAGPLSVSLRLRRLVTEHQREWKRLEVV